MNVEQHSEREARRAPGQVSPSAVPVHIGYCVNRKMLKPLCVSVFSAASACPVDRPLHIWVFHTDLSTRDQYELREVLRPFAGHYHLNLRPIDTSTFSGLNGLHGQVVPFGKALIPNMLRQEVDRLIYLDADTVVLGGLDELYDTDLASYTMGAVSYETFGQTQQAQFFLEEGLDLGERAFNSGVMLLNVQQWVDLNITQQVVDLIHRHHYRYRGADQPILNLVFYRNFMPLRIRFNKRASASLPLDSAEVNDGIIHFVGIPKPFDLAGRWANKNFHIYSDVCRRARVQPLGVIETIRNEGLVHSLKGLRSVFA